MEKPIITSDSLYRAFGLVIHSDIPIPGASLLAENPGHEPDLRITRGAPPLSGRARTLGSFALGDGGALLFSMAGVAQYGIVDKVRILVQPVDGADPNDVSVMLAATALPAALWQRGEVILHAAAALPPGCARALAILGPSRSGKSTLLRSLLAGGSQVLADDALSLRPPASPDAHTLVSGLAGGIAERLDASHPHTGHFPPWKSLAVPPEQQCHSAPLGTVLVLRMGPDTPPASRLTRLGGPHALTALLNNLHRSRVPRLLGTMPQVLAQLAAVLRHVPVYEWVVGAGEHRRLPTPEDLGNL